MNLVGDVSGKRVIIIDDIIDTAGTLCEGVKKLKEAGATSISAFGTHGLFSGPALQRIEESEIDSVITTNSLPTRENEE